MPGCRTRLLAVPEATERMEVEPGAKCMDKQRALLKKKISLIARDQRRFTNN